MAGRTVHYPGSLSMNVLDVCGLQCSSFGRWDDASADTVSICNAGGRIYRSLHWTDDRLTGAIFVGRPHDMGMLTDVGMVKGLIQTRIPLGPWKDYLRDNPFDVRRVYVASRVAEQLARRLCWAKPPPIDATAAAASGRITCPANHTLSTSTGRHDRCTSACD